MTKPVNRPHYKTGRKPLPPDEKEKSLAKRKVYSVNHRKNLLADKPAKRMLYSARQRAKAQGVPCTITEQDIQQLIPTHCPYLGIELKSCSVLGEPRDNVMSLDKLNPEAGYVEGNIEVISWLANNMKNSATPEQLVKFAKTILERYD